MEEVIDHTGHDDAGCGLADFTRAKGLDKGQRQELLGGILGY